MKQLYNFTSKCYYILNKSHLLNKKLCRKMTTLENLKFDNLALKTLPIDKEETNYVRTVSDACFSKVNPTPVKNPKVVCVSPSALRLLDLNEHEIKREDFAEYFSGNKLLPGSEPAAHCYCGHQFGYFSGQLGDGAAIYLGEIINKKDERWEIQLKGAGLTPYSRTADGRKVLRSTIREFLCSEAMHFLGIATTRAGTCITSESEVIRDIFYDGHAKAEKCAVLLRISPTFIRFGSFEIFKTLDPITGRVGPSVGRVEILHNLLNYVIDTFYSEITASAKDQRAKYLSFFKEIVLRTARLVAEWQCVGFCHGVLNTDNMSIIGLTLDYGPFGFMDMYNPNHICNASDDGGRYSYIKQPEICLWNLNKLAEAIQQALPLEFSLPLLDLYQPEFQSTYLKKMQNKLGLISRESQNDEKLIQELLDTMEATGADFTNTFLCFSFIVATSLKDTIKITLVKLLEQCYSLQIMIDNYNPNINDVQLQTYLAIVNSHPELLNRLGRAGLSIQRIIAQIQKLESLKEMSEEEKRENDEMLWKSWLQKYEQRLVLDIESYKGDISSYNSERLALLKNNNPRFILRNYLLQEAINKAENEDDSEVQKLLNLLEKPFEFSYFETINRSNIPENEKCELKDSSSDVLSHSDQMCDKAPTWSFSIKVT